MKNNDYKDLSHIMAPKSVAIIGASSNPDKVGHVILQNYIDAGYSGKIYPVNIKNEGTILGLKAYASVLDIKKPIDVGVIAVPAMAVPQVMEECGKAGVKGLVVVSGGFLEVGNAQLQDQLVAIARKYSMPTIGPNCLGVMDPRSRIDTLFLPTYKIDRPKIGGVSFAAQSGAVGSAVLDMIGSEGFGIARFLSYGNAADVDEVDILNYLGNDKDTKVIVYYIEGVKRGKEFIEVAKKVTKIKPVVISKGGVTAAGAGAAHSHTASLAGSSQAYEAVFRQFGFTIAKDLKDLINYAKIFDTQPLATGKKIAILTNGGGIGVLATDALYNNGLELATLTKDSEDRLRKLMPETVNIRMPMDLVGDADDKRYTDALSVVGDDPNVDAILAIVLFQTPGADSRLASSLVSFAAKMKKPMVGLSVGGSYTHAHRQMMENAGMPVYESPDDAAGSLAALINYSRYRKGIA
ncbi:MAG TPA: CoA-binding protein [Candidatus Acidoferrales bacterium]|nr:CoA-binding protein [Candidatus Acidoferrales bacterium]